MIKAVIFDHDGVIADTEPIHFKADNIVLSMFGYGIGASENESLVGISTKKSWEIFREMFKIPEEVDYLVQEKTRVAVEILGKEGIKPNEGLLQLLEKLKSSGYSLAIASGQYRKVIDAVLTKLKIASYFSVIVSGEETAKGKPSPELFLTAAKRLNMNPEECAVIEDSESGVLAAKAAGMLCVALKMPSTASHDITAADKIVSSLSEITMEDFQR